MFRITTVLLVALGLAGCAVSEDGEISLDPLADAMTHQRVETFETRYGDMTLARNRLTGKHVLIGRGLDGEVDFADYTEILETHRGRVGENDYLIIRGREADESTHYSFINLTEGEISAFTIPWPLEVLSIAKSDGHEKLIGAARLAQRDPTNRVFLFRYGNHEFERHLALRDFSSAERRAMLGEDPLVRQRQPTARQRSRDQHEAAEQAETPAEPAPADSRARSSSAPIDPDLDDAQLEPVDIEAPQKVPEGEAGAASDADQPEVILHELGG